MKRRNGQGFVGAWVPEELFDAFEREAGNRRNAKSEILRELLTERYLGRRSLSPAERHILAAIRGLEGEAPEAVEAVLRFAREAADPKSRRTALVVSDSLARHAQGATDSGPRRKARRAKV